MLHRYVRGIRHHNAELGLLEKRIAGHASASEDARILMSMTGIDYYAAMLLASEIDGHRKVCLAKKLVSWAGMRPIVHQSGNTMYHGRMKKDSNRKVNWVLIQAAHVAVLYDGRMRDYYERDEKDPPQQHRYHARCEQDDQDNLAHADKQGSVQGQKRETLSEKA